MKSSYVLIIVIFVILVAGTVIAKLASQIQLAPKRAPVVQYDDDPEPEVVDEPTPKVLEPIGLQHAIANQLVQFSWDADRHLEIAVANAEKPLSGPIAINAGTILSEADDRSWVTVATQEIDLNQGSSLINVIPMAPGSTESSTTIVGNVVPLQLAESNSTLTQLVTTPRFLEADEAVRQLAVWALNDVALDDVDESIRRPQNPRLQSLPLQDEYSSSVEDLLAGVTVDVLACRLIRESRAAIVESEAAAAIGKVYDAITSNDDVAISAALKDVEAKAGLLNSDSAISTESSAIAEIWKLRSQEPTLSALPTTVVSQIDEQISQLRQQNYPVEDLEQQASSTAAICLLKCQKRGMLGQVKALAERLGDDNGSIEPDMLTQLRSAEVDFLAAYQRQFSVLEEKSILPTFIVDEAKLMFAPDEKIVSILKRRSAVDFDQIVPSKQRDVTRQISIVYLDLAEAAVKHRLPDLAELFAKRVMAQKIKAPGVTSKAQKILRTLTRP